jgi:hypothetical protein
MKDLSKQYQRPIGDRATEEDIYFAYRLFLRREPDSDGFKHHRRHVVDDGITVERLASNFLNSDEYRLHREAAVMPIAVDMCGYHVAHAQRMDLVPLCSLSSSMISLPICLKSIL